MNRLKELFERKGNLVSEIRKLSDLIAAEKRAFSADEQKKWDDLNKEFDSINSQIVAIQRADEIAKQVPGKENDQPNKRAEVTEEKRSLALQGWCKTRCGKEISADQSAAAADVGLNLNSSEIEFNLNFRAPKNEAEYRIMSTTTGSEGGFTIPTGFVNNFEKALLQFNSIRQVADILRTDSGNEMPWPTGDDTANEGEQVGENTAVADLDIVVGQMILNAYLFSSKMVKAPISLLEDSAFNFSTIIGDMLGERIGRILENKFAVGTGTSTPKGIVPASTLGKTTATATAILADELLDLIHSIDPAYRANAKFMMNDAIILAIRKLKGLDNQYLWQPGLSANIPDRISGYPFFVNQKMSSAITAGQKTVIFGDLSKYKIREVRGIRLRVLNERYAEKDQVGFIAFMRADGDLLDAGTHPVKHIIQHA